MSEGFPDLEAAMRLIKARVFGTHVCRIECRLGDDTAPCEGVVIEVETDSGSFTETAWFEHAIEPDSFDPLAMAEFIASRVVAANQRH